MSSILALLLAAFMAFVVWRLVAGAAKFAVLAVIVVAVLYFLSQGGLG